MMQSLLSSGGPSPPRPGGPPAAASCQREASGGQPASRTFCLDGVLAPGAHPRGQALGLWGWCVQTWEGAWHRAQADTRVCTLLVHVGTSRAASCSRSTTLAQLQAPTLLADLSPGLLPAWALLGSYAQPRGGRRREWGTQGALRLPPGLHYWPCTGVRREAGGQLRRAWAPVSATKP